MSGDSKKHSQRKTLLADRRHRIGLVEAPIDREKFESVFSRGGISNPTPRSFWMIPKRSSIVILNLIAKVPFLDHKAENRRTNVE